MTEALRAAIAVHLAARLGPLESLAVVPSGRLAGGHVARGLELFDATAVDGDGVRHVARFVLKHTWANEVLALRALRHVPDGHRLPVALAEGSDDGGPWVLLPFHEGGHPPGRLAVPAEVFDVVARVHAHWEERTDALAGIVVIDAAWWSVLCERVVLPVVEAALATRPHPALAEARDGVREAAADPRVARALDRLPATLLHGDMHDGNVVEGPGGVHVIDWGNARVGPALVDVANVAAWDSPNLHRYLDARAALAGRALDPLAVEIGYRLGTVVVNTQYLAFAVEHLAPADALAMTVARRQALDVLGRLLERRA